MIGLKPFDPLAIVLVAGLNPVVIGVGYLMGRSADQWQKLPVAGFAAALAGFVLAWLAIYLRLLPAEGVGSVAGLVIAQFGFGLLWACVGFWMQGRGKR